MNAFIDFKRSVLAVCLTSSVLAAGQNPCQKHPTQKDWPVFLNLKHGFCFQYPPEYKAAPSGPSSNNVASVSKSLGRLATKPGPELPLADDEENATIEVFQVAGAWQPFRLDALKQLAPTGLDEIPPERIRAAHTDFFYYGPGGGGVDYPDNFFFGLRGKMLLIQFTGPYVDDGSPPTKSPPPSTKAIERKVLASFQRIPASDLRR